MPSKYPDIGEGKRGDLLRLIAEVPPHYEAEDFIFCPWCDRMSVDENYDHWPDGKSRHKKGCPVLQARDLLANVKQGN